MIDKREILEAASTLSLLPNVVEKDYVLGWLLAGINVHPELADSWVFKGGTCLKKCYFETYRFSEDLDFTLRDESQIAQAFLQRVLGEVIEWVCRRVRARAPDGSTQLRHLPEPARAHLLPGKDRLSRAGLPRLKRRWMARDQARPHGGRATRLARRPARSLPSLYRPTRRRVVDQLLRL